MPVSNSPLYIMENIMILEIESGYEHLPEYQSLKLVMRVRLTKKLLMSLPANVLLQSNCCAAMYAAVFEDGVKETMAEREEQWREIVAANASCDSAAAEHQPDRQSAQGYCTRKNPHA